MDNRNPRLCLPRRLARAAATTIAALALTGLPAFADAATSSIPTVRYSGSDRFQTAAAVSQNTFAAGCGCVAYIANAFNFPDALAGAAAAGTVKGPILLVAPTGTPNAATLQELTRLQPSRIVVLGGSGAVSADTLEALRPYAPAIVRYAGSDRFSTAAEISKQTFAASCGCVAYVANAYNFPDALAGAAAAGKTRGPVLLVAATGPVNPATGTELARLHPARIVVLGGTGAVSAAVATALSAYGSVDRYAGADRYATAVAISAHTFGADCRCVVYLANAQSFPDALAGAAAAGTVQGPVLLVDAAGAPSTAVITEIGRLKPVKMIVLGGPSAVSDQIASRLATRYAPGTPLPATWSKNLYVSSLVRYQDPDRTACTAAVSMTMLNFVGATDTEGQGFSWGASISYAEQEDVLAWERNHMTMLATSKGSDPHGVRNALNFFGWGTYTDSATFHYADLAFASFDDAVRAIVQAIARYDRPVAILAWAGKHMQLVSGYAVFGQDPAKSTDFDVLTLYLTDPLVADGLANASITYAGFASGSTTYRFRPYAETDSPNDDPYTAGTVASRDEWYGKFVVVAPVR